MKRFITFLCCLLIAVASFAQNANQHLKFMGVPINGTIAQFQSKLVAKGCTYDKVASSTIEKGCRAFNGVLVGNKVEIYVYYNTQTNIVYRAKAVVSGISEEIADQSYSKIKKLLSQKYDYMSEGTKDDKECCYFFSVKNPDEDIDFNNISNLSEVASGEIDLFITKDDEEWRRSPFNFNLHIDYTDAINKEKNDNSMLDEL